MPGLAPALERLPVGVLQVSFDGRIHALNDCLAGWLGRPRRVTVTLTEARAVHEPSRKL